MTLLRTVARPLLASMFVYGGASALRNAPMMAEHVKPTTDKIAGFVQSVVPGASIPTDPESMVRINGALHLGFGTALALGRFPRLSAAVLAATLVPTTLAGHSFWDEDDASTAANQKIHFTKNLSMMGGLLMATLDPEPHKKILPRRAKDQVVKAGGHVQDSVQSTAKQVKKSLPL
ncbi:DoxX family protein [Mumia sp. zg.B53]|uniref:DoxX family protein n=1 Tax=unclassified Mumia TaxID=2621872 RepID=UPI001C6F2243|nr:MULTISPECIES: DoxX family protein [unclassified Mumia]MBW9206634.1 DoxX family protein [Mumia sp. zg.B17]MBW9215644.1 DoxX family protein [Mumia sp. zg.B53]MDD9347867.1 DoxX family protein [Mumia sp.]